MSLAGCPIVRVIRRGYFSAAVRYFNPRLTLAENQAVYGKAYSAHGSGHNYVLEAYVEGPVDHQSGMIMEIGLLEELIGHTTQKLDHKFLNVDVPFFTDVVPTVENVARFCYEDLSLLLQKHAHLTLQKVRLYETDDLWVDVGRLAQPEV